MTHVDRRTCLRCGHEGYDVRLTVVEYDDPAPVTVEIPVSSRADAITEKRVVPGRYGSEWRCLDVGACDERTANLAALGSAQPAPDEVDVASFFAGLEPTGGVGG